MKIRGMAAKHPHRKAFIWAAGKDRTTGKTRYKHITYGKFEEQTDAYAYGLKRIGICRGVKTIVLIKPDIRLFLFYTALLKIGAIPIMIDAGMGVGNMLKCLSSTQAEAFIGIPIAHVLRVLNKNKFTSIKTHVTIGPRLFWKGYSVDTINQPQERPFPINDPGPHELAAIFFTTGSTGPAKGVEFTPMVMNAQVEQIRSFLGLAENEIDLATYPMFALFDIVLGNTAVFPDMDPTKPAHVNPKHIISTINDLNITNIFASPALLSRVGKYATKRGVTFPSVKRVLSGGAPVSAAIMEKFASTLHNAQVFSIYGATECLPVSYVGSNEVLAEQSKSEKLTNGTCVGKPLPGVEVRIITITDAPIALWSDDLLAEKGQVGEITVRCDHLSKKYYHRTDADAVHKIKEGGTIWHRMGDLGRIDENGNMWFCGRKNHRVMSENRTFFTVPCENIFNTHPLVKRSALVGIDLGQGVLPVMCVEPEKNIKPDHRMTKDLLDTASKYTMTESINRIEYFDIFPVDIRHNAKIFREQLAENVQKRYAANH